MSKDIILDIEELGLDFEEKGAKRTIINHLNLLQKEGEWLSLIGSNGAGKTSLGLIIKGLLNPTRGHLRMFSQDTDEDLRLRKNKIGFLFAGDSMLAFFNIGYFRSYNCAIIYFNRFSRIHIGNNMS